MISGKLVGYPTVMTAISQSIGAQDEMLHTGQYPIDS
jgi:hypothetical protein